MSGSFSAASSSRKRFITARPRLLWLLPHKEIAKGLNRRVSKLRVVSAQQTPVPTFFEDTHKVSVDLVRRIFPNPRSDLARR